MSRLAWCTGAGKGIGRATALELAKDGWRVAVSARTADDLESLVAESPRYGQIVAFPVDVTDEKATRETIEGIEAAHGPIDLALLNAGTHIPMPVTEFQTATFRALFEVNVFGVVHSLSALLPRFMERRSGHIAVVSSVAGYCGLPTAAAYGATKAALITMCEALKPELDHYNVKLSVINPGFVKTPLTDRNTFKMPFLVSTEYAAKRIVSRLKTGQFEISFPRRFTFGMKVLRCLPYALYFPIVRRMLPKRQYN